MDETHALGPTDDHDRSRLQLPGDVLKALLDGIPTIVEQARRLLGPVAERREDIRAALDTRGRLKKIPTEPVVDTIASVDGAQAVDNLYAGDLVTAVALAAEGLQPSGLVGNCIAHSEYTRFTNHDSDLDRLAKAAMTCQELALLRGLPHDLCILDGSHITPVVILNSALSSVSPEVRRLAIEVCEEYETVDAITELCDPKRGQRIVACPKSDSSVFLAKYLSDELHLPLPASDRFIATMVLEPGWMLGPIKPPTTWADLHILARAQSKDSDAHKLARKLDNAISPLRIARAAESVGIIYVRPESCSTVVKAEFKASLGRDWGMHLARAIADETPGPHLQEPFSQYLADQWAKAVGVGVDAQLAGLRLEFSANGAADCLEYLIRSYRTLGGQ